MKFNLEDYEQVQDRIPKFFAKFPDGRIIPEIISQTENAVTIKATLYKDAEEQKAGCPLAVGLAHEMRDMEIKVNKWGKEYESVNYSCWVENCETSAIGRALANIGIHGAKRPSREEMEKAERARTQKQNKRDEMLGDIEHVKEATIEEMGF